MTTPITAELAELIRKQLPAHLSETLQAELATLASLRENAAAMQRKVEKAEAEADRLTSKLREHMAIDARESQLKTREAAVTLRELKAELNEFKVVAADQARSEMRDIVHSVFANSRFKYHETASRDVVLPSSGGGSYLQRATSDKAGSIEQ
jgi:hypothetical protein